LLNQAGFPAHDFSFYSASLIFLGQFIEIL